MIGSLVEIVRHIFIRKGRSPGKSIIAQTRAGAGQERELDFYQLPGIASGPTEGDRGITIQTQGGRIIVGTCNYKIELNPNTGETILYSTNQSGDSVEARIDLKNNGNIELNGNSKSFVTYSELNTALTNYVTQLNLSLASGANGAGPVIFAVPPPSSIDISTAETTSIKTGG